MVTLSIITPAFNAADWLPACIENVVGQGCKQIEHLIVDGGSQDGSTELLQEFTLKYKHIRWVSEPDNGQSDAMNKGIRLAQGKWVCFLNADDYFENNALKSVLNLIEKNPDRVCLLVGNLNIRDAADNLISVNKPSSMTLPKLLADICQWPFNPSAYFYPKSLHDLIGFFPEEEHFAMDYDFILRVMSARIPIEYHDQTWGNFRLQPQAKTLKDQESNESYHRANRLRIKYYSVSPVSIRLKTKTLISIWAIRNKFLGIFKRITSLMPRILFCIGFHK